jgi:hypothetical protein
MMVPRRPQSRIVFIHECATIVSNAQSTVMLTGIQIMLVAQWLTTLGMDVCQHLTKTCTHCGRAVHVVTSEDFCHLNVKPVSYEALLDAPSMAQ